MAVRRFALAAAVVLLAVGGCARREPPPEPRPPVQPRPAPRPAPPVPSAADFVSRAGSIDLFLIRSSELALARSRNPQVTALAREMLRTHAGTSSQLSLAGRRLNLLPSITLRPEHEVMMRQLLQSPDFERLYLLQLERAHRESVDLHGLYAAGGRSPTLKPVAASALPVERRHLQQVQAMR